MPKIVSTLSTKTPYRYLSACTCMKKLVHDKYILRAST
jgi:hypothetical protein